MPAFVSLTHRARAVLLVAVLSMLTATAIAYASVGSEIFSAAAASTSPAPVPAWTPAERDTVAAGTYEPHQLLVGLKSGVSAQAAITQIRKVTGLRVSESSRGSGAPHTLLLQLPTSAGVTSAAAAVSAALKGGASYAQPNYVASAANARWIPNDTGKGDASGGWQQLQWNFNPRAGVSAPGAWANLRADKRPGASGVTIAVVDTGVAFQNYKQFRKAPDFAKTKFVDPCDLVDGRVTASGKCTDPHAVDRDDHGTFVTAEIAETTNNHRGVTGLAYGAKIMPVRVLGDQGLGSESQVAAGIRYAANHGAQVINLSLEFGHLPKSRLGDVTSAIRYAHDKGIVIVGVSGNEGDGSLDYPGADSDVISVAATTYDACLAVYSNFGKGLDISAPGGGNDRKMKQAGCNPNRNLPSIYQTTFADPNRPGSFSLPSGWFGTSMAAPEVSAAAAMVIASGVIGSHPTPAQVLDRLEATARPIDGSVHSRHYGYGLLDVYKATLPGGPTAPKPHG